MDTSWGVQAMRRLQFQMYSAERYSRLKLRPVGEPTYFSHLIANPQMRPLAQQQDPMGLTVGSVRVLLLFDVFVTVGR